MTLSDLQQGARQCLDLIGEPNRVIAHVEREIRRHLIVARPSRVDLPARSTGKLGDPPLDRHVDIHVARLEREATFREFALHLIERGVNGLAIALRDDASGGEHRGVGAGLRHVVRPEPAIHVQRAIERLKERVLGLGEARHAGLVSQKQLAEPLCHARDLRFGDAREERQG